ncbi:MAG: hypothetical protein WD512_20175 [Candidatus Paceibacterota bacterium]
MDNGIKSILINNIGTILIVGALIFGYFTFKKSEREIGEMKKNTELLIHKMNSSMIEDSIRSVIENQKRDSILKINSALLKDINYIRKQNNVIHEENNQFFKRYDSLVINRPDF